VNFSVFLLTYITDKDDILFYGYGLSLKQYCEPLFTPFNNLSDARMTYLRIAGFPHSTVAWSSMGKALDPCTLAVAYSSMWRKGRLQNLSMVTVWYK
jgi:hypothetical protein